MEREDKIAISPTGKKDLEKISFKILCLPTSHKFASNYVHLSISVLIRFLLPGGLDFYLPLLPQISFRFPYL